MLNIRITISVTISASLLPHQRANSLQISGHSNQVISIINNHTYQSPISSFNQYQGGQISKGMKNTFLNVYVFPKQRKPVPYSAPSNPNIKYDNHTTFNLKQLCFH